MNANDERSDNVPAPDLSVVALITDAYGGYGGIAEFKRGLLEALLTSPLLKNLAVVARSGKQPPANPGNKQLVYRVASHLGKVGFVLTALVTVLQRRPRLLVIGHINFCFLGVLLARLTGCRTMLLIYGGEAWRARKWAPVNRSLAAVDHVVSISELTLHRFQRWANVDPARCAVLPCCVDTAVFSPGPPDAALRSELGLTGKRVMMTMGRLATEERAKGFDEVIELLPRLAATLPDVAYLICGAGNDRRRLATKAAALGVAGRVVFAGYVADADKVRYYRVADAFVMPSRGEGFGIVMLEALACGLPVLGSSIDGTREALLDGRMGLCVDPGDADALFDAVLRVLKRPRGAQPPALCEHYSRERFDSRVRQLVEKVHR